MAMTCARCGAQNPDGNLYCQSCGTPLAPAAQSPAAPPAAQVGPPPAYPPPPPGYAPPPQPGYAPPPPGYAPSPIPGAAGGYQSPYYAPTGPGVAVHRTPWMLIIAGVVALVVLMAGCGTALAVLGSRGSSNPNQAESFTTDVPTPSPGQTPSPIPTPSPSPAAGSSSTSNDGVSLTLPSGWSVENSDNEAITLTDPNSEGSVTVASGQSSPAQTAEDNRTTIDQYFTQQYPDAKPCPGSKASSGTFNGAKGIAWEICFTIASGGQSVAAAASLFAGANQSGNVYYIVMLITRQENLAHYVSEARPVLQSVHWKLS